MTFETVTRLDPAGVLGRAVDFFGTRVPATGAFVETQSASHVVLRGQGGEEVVVAVMAIPGGTAVRGSTILFGQPLRRFFSTLPPVAEEVA